MSDVVYLHLKLQGNISLNLQIVIILILIGTTIISISIIITTTMHAKGASNIYSFSRQYPTHVLHDCVPNHGLSHTCQMLL